MTDNTTETITCTKTCCVNNIEYYTAGKTYAMKKHKNGVFIIMTNQNTPGYVGKGFMVEKLEDYFDTQNIITPIANLKINPAKINMNQTMILRLQFVCNPITKDCIGGIEYEVPIDFATLIYNNYYKNKYSDVDDMDERMTDAERMQVYTIADKNNMITSDIELCCY